MVSLPDNKLNMVGTRILLCFSMLCFSLNMTAQSNINVDHFTGTANVSIPIYTIQENGLNIPIGLSYSTSGVKVSDVSGLVGLGWNLVTGGSIVREVRGLPDDYKIVSRKGWLHNDAGSKILAFNPLADNDLSNCQDANENTDYLALEDIHDEYDMEPDVFYINTPFISGRFMFDNNKLIQLQPYQDIDISYETDVDGKLISFTILDANGLSYIFDVYDYVGITSASQGHESNFKVTREIMGSSIRSYASNWHLSKIIFPNAEAVRFNYEPLPINLREVRKSYNASLNSYSKKAKEFSNNTTSDGSIGVAYKEHSASIISSIETPSGVKVEFEISSRYDTVADHKLSKIRIYQNKSHLSHEFDFYYNSVLPFDATPLEYIYQSRSFLSAVHRRKGDNVLPGYDFDYYGVYESWCDLPSFSSTSKDFWGYYNMDIDDESGQFYYPNLQSHHKYRVRKLPGGTELEVGKMHNGGVNPQSIDIGTLSKVTYPTGGNVQFYYEPKEYYDAFADDTYHGNGLRIEKTIVHDGVSYKNDLKTTYEYKDGDISSGRITEKPAFAFGGSYHYGKWATTPPSGQWNHTGYESYDDVINSTSYSDQTKQRKLSVKTNFNMAPNSQVFYEKVAVNQEGKGKVVYTYQIPAMMDDTNVNSGEWNPSEVKVARSSSACYAIGNLQTGSNVHPFPYNPNYDFQRGLLDKVERFGENGQIVSSSIYEYQRIYKNSSIDITYGLKMEKIPTYIQGNPAENPGTAPYLYQYSKYRLFNNVRNAVKKLTEQVYEPNDETQSTESVSEYEYSSLHKKLIKMKTTNSDGSLHQTYTRYPEDYDIQKSAGDKQTEMIESLVSQHIFNLPIEQYSTITPQGGNETMVGGSLTMFSDFGQDKILPYQRFQLKSRGTLLESAFNASSIDNSGANSLFNKDGNYLITGTISSYDAINNPLTTIGRSKVNTGTHWGYNKTFAHASIGNAASEEFLYTGFETNTDFAFSFDEGVYGTTPISSGRTGLNALSMETGVSKALTGTFDKKNTDDYLFSCWIANPSSAGSLTLTFKDNTTAVVQGTASLNFSNNADWTYYEMRIDASTFSEELYVELSTNELLKIDDVLLYPADASVTYSNLDNKRQLASVTNSAGITTYYSYDELGRNLLVRDDDQHILNKNTYTDINATPPPHPYFRYEGINCNGESVFKLDNPSQTGYDYIWSFSGDTDYSGTDLKTIEHTFGQAGVETVQLAITKDGHTEKFAQTLDVVLEPEAEICAAGPRQIDICDINTAKALFNDGCYNATGNQVAPTVFLVNQIRHCFDCDSQNITYRWEVQHEGTSTWVNVGTKSSVSLIYNDSFTVRCVLTVGCATPIDIISNTKSVMIFKSDPTCPDITLTQD